MVDQVSQDISKDVKNAKVVYYLYLASLIVGVTSIIGVVIAYLNRKEAPDWVQTHYQLQIRTFWIGLLYSFISGLLIYIIIGYLLLIGVVVWYIIRCVKGLQYLDKFQPYPNPTTWWF